MVRLGITWLSLCKTRHSSAGAVLKCACVCAVFAGLWLREAVHVQAHSREEAADFVKVASALLVNVGTLSPEWVDGMRAAACAAKSLNKPWVLDPVGAGATPFRTQARPPYCMTWSTPLHGCAPQVAWRFCWAARAPACRPCLSQSSPVDGCLHTG